MEKELEQRQSSRKAVRFSVKYFYLPPTATPPETRTINLSVDGACVETLDPLQAGASVAFFIVTPDHQAVDVRAQVVYTQSAERPPHRAGVRFTHVSPSDRVVLEHAIETASQNSN